MAWRRGCLSVSSQYLDILQVISINNSYDEFIYAIKNLCNMNLYMEEQMNEVRHLLTKKVFNNIISTINKLKPF